MAKIEIDSNYVTEYRNAIKEHTKAALANEPGVLTNETLKMAKSLKLINVDPIAFGAKPDLMKSSR